MIWEQLGFRKNPYFWEELEVNPEDFELFVGREIDSRKFLINAANANGGIILVEGTSGVGKSSFVNYNQYILYKGRRDVHPEIVFSLPHLLPGMRKIQLRDSEPIGSVFLKVISGALFSILTVCRENSIQIPRKLDGLNDQVSRIVSNVKGYDYDAMALGIGSSPSKNQNQHPALDFQELSYLESLDLMVDVVTKEIGYDGIMIPINNLDILSQDYLCSTLDYFRDSLFNKKNIWWVLLGPLGLEDNIVRRVPRLSASITGDAIKLSPLSANQIEALFDERVQHFALDKRNTPHPVSKRIVNFLYQESSGDIRYVFRILNEVVRRIFYEYPSITEINEDLAAQEIAKLTLDELKRHQFSIVEKKIVNYIVANHKDKEFTAPNISKCLKENEDIISDALNSLLEKNLLQRKITRTDIIYFPKGPMSLAQTFQFNKYSSVWDNLMV